jgi:hypothetical protein
VFDIPWQRKPWCCKTRIYLLHLLHRSNVLKLCSIRRCTLLVVLKSLDSSSLSWFCWQSCLMQANTVFCCSSSVIPINWKSNNFGSYTYLAAGKEGMIVERYIKCCKWLYVFGIKRFTINFSLSKCIRSAPLMSLDLNKQA